MALIFTLLAIGVPPVLSEEGKKRVLENLKTIEENIVDMKENLTNTSANLKTLQAEARELEELEKEHISLKKKYEGYLLEANLEIKKNEDLIANLDSREKDLAKDPKHTNELTKVREQKRERTLWKGDAEIKTSQASKLLEEMVRKLSDIQSRKQPLQNQLQSWIEREREYRKLLQRLISKKSELESFSVLK